MAVGNSQPHVVVLGGNFAGLGSAQKVREYAGDGVRITVIDRKDYLLFVPNIPADIFEDKDPALRQRMDLRPTLAADGIEFIQGEVVALDPDARTVDFIPNERPGGERQRISYDYLVVTLGNPTNEAQAARLDLRPVAAKLGGKVKVTDVVSGCVCPPIGRSMVLAIPANSFRVVRIEPER